MRSMEVRAHTLCGDTREPVRANLLGERYSTLRFANGAATTLSGGTETQYSIGLRHNKSPVSTTSMPVKPLKSLTCQDFNRTISYQIELRISSVSTQSRSPGDVLCPLGVTRSEVDDILQKKDPTGEISGYSEVHLATCVKAIQDCIVEHHTGHPECKSPGH